MDGQDENRVVISTGIVSRDEQARRSMGRMMRMIHESAYKNQPKKLAAAEKREGKRQKRQRVSEAAGSGMERANHGRKVAQRHGITDEDLVDQMVVLVIELNKDLPPDQWRDPTAFTIAESEYTTAATHTSYLRLLTKSNINTPIAKMCERFKAEAVDRLEKKDGRVTTPAELAAKLMAKEELMGKISDEDRKYMVDELMKLYRDKGERMPKPEAIKRSPTLVYSEVLRAFGGSYESFKREFREVAQNYQPPEPEEAQVQDMPAVFKEAAEDEQPVEPESVDEPEPEESVDETAPEEPAEESAPPESAPKKRKKTKYFCTMEDVITNLNEYFVYYGELPTMTSLRERRAAGESWLSWNTFARNLGPKGKDGEGWMKYIDEWNLPEKQEKPEASEEDPEPEIPDVPKVPQETVPAKVAPPRKVAPKVVASKAPAGLMEVLTGLEFNLKIKLPGVAEPLVLSFDISPK